MRPQAVLAALALAGLLPALASWTSRAPRAVQPSVALAASQPAAPLPASGDDGAGNLLRNGRFQDDWVTLLPETKNHHWAYPSEFANRRDYNPDGWACTGSWTWQNADAAAGERRFVLRGPSAQATQRVNAFAVHDDRTSGGSPDSGGFPGVVVPRSRTPERLVPDLTARVRLRGRDVAEKGGTLEVAFFPWGGDVMHDAFGAAVPPLARASVPLPAGSYEDRTVEVPLPATAWLEAARAAAARTPEETAAAAKEGTLLPATAGVTLRYAAAGGEIEVREATLVARHPTPSPDLLPNGSFETVMDGYPTGWSRAAKYRYFPPRHYYLWNTWHNDGFDNRGHATADRLVLRSGGNSLRMILPAGDEQAVTSDPIPLNQKELRLIEVSAWVKTDRLNMIQIDALDEKGQRLDGFNSIQKVPHSIGTDDWRVLRQVFRPREPVRTLRLMLCARGVNGYTLDDTGQQPQNNVVGHVWWDDLRLSEPETPPAELTARGVAVPPAPRAAAPGSAYLAELDAGERLQGENTLRVVLVNPGPAGTYRLRWTFAAPSGKPTRVESEATSLPAGGRREVKIPYSLTGPGGGPYSEYQGTVHLIDGSGKELSSSEVWFAVRNPPIDLELGALYLQPQQSQQFVRMNFGFSASRMAQLAKVRLDVLRRGTGERTGGREVPATPAAILAQRSRIPVDLREDFGNLLLADLDVSALPVQAFADPQRNWFVRATALDASGKPLASVDSPPFCRLAHAPPQPPVRSVRIQDNFLRVNDQPWIPWGAIYGHVPVYAGPAVPGAGQVRDLANLPPWSMYDRYGATTYTRRVNDLNCLRYVAGAVTDLARVQKPWDEDNLYASTAFVTPQPVYSLQELEKGAGGRAPLDQYLAWARQAPMVVSITPGVEESFGTFHAATPEQLQGMGEVVNYLRRHTAKPVMVSHGGYWNRFEFEKVPYYDIYDPETEPLFPANVHVDLWPLFNGGEKVAWLRPQMYEDVPYERWRFHTYVELMRGVRGWQFAHGPGDASLFRGLHGELESLRAVIASPDRGPAVTVEPAMEHWRRRLNGKLTLIAATTHGITRGPWRWDKARDPAGDRSRVTGSSARELAPAGASVSPDRRPVFHGIQYLPDALAWPAGTRLAQWVRLEAGAAPESLAILLKTNGRWAKAAAWGPFDIAAYRANPLRAYNLLKTLYPNAEGFLGWDMKLVDRALPYLPEKAAAMGALPAADRWVRLEVPLDTVGAAGALLDGVGFMHAGGRVRWGRTALLAPDGKEHVVWGDSLSPPVDQLARTRVRVPGLKAGTKVRVLFEDREIVAEEGGFTDDFRGQDLYQRHGGGPGNGYGDTPVALHLYEIPLP